MFKQHSAAGSTQKQVEPQPQVDFEQLSRQTGVSVEELRALASSSGQAASGQFAADYARLQSPEYQRLARKAEQSVAGKLGFRRFGERR